MMNKMNGTHEQGDPELLPLWFSRGDECFGYTLQVTTDSVEYADDVSVHSVESTTHLPREFIESLKSGGLLIDLGGDIGGSYIALAEADRTETLHVRYCDEAYLQGSGSSKAMWKPDPKIEGQWRRILKRKGVRCMLERKLKNAAGEAQSCKRL